MTVAKGVAVTPEVLRIADNAPLILSLHRDLDALREDAASATGTKIGTTRRGIGPAYEDKVGRRAIRVGDLGEPDYLARKVETLLAHHNALRQGLGRPTIDGSALLADLLDVLTGLAGCLFAHKMSFISPEMFTLLLSLEFIMVIIIGGIFGIHGAILGAVFIVMIDPFLTLLKDDVPGFIASIGAALGMAKASADSLQSTLAAIGSDAPEAKQAADDLVAKMTRFGRRWQELEVEAARTDPADLAGRLTRMEQQLLATRDPQAKTDLERARDRLGAGAEIAGPALIQERGTTTVLFEHDRCVVTPSGELIVTVGEA